MNGNFDNRGLRIPQSYGVSGYNQGQGGNFGGSGNSFGDGIGTTPTEQMMRGGMGGMSNMMQADHGFGGQGNYQGNYSGSQYGQPQYGYNQFGGTQYGTNNQSNIGTTQSEQMMQGGMSSMMQADRNFGGQGNYQGNYGSSQYAQPQYGYNQFGGTQYGMNNQSNIGTTRTEQMLQSGMGGMSSMMQADRNLGSQNYPSNYGQQSAFGQTQYGYGSNQFGSGMSGNQFGYGQSDIGTTSSEQSMQGGMGGMSSMMQADRRNQSMMTSPSTQYGYGTQYSQMGNIGSNSQGYAGTGYGYGSQYSNQSAGQNFGSSNQQGVYNPGDTPLERAAKQNMNPGSISGGSQF